MKLRSGLQLAAPNLAPFTMKLRSGLQIAAPIPTSRPAKEQSTQTEEQTRDFGMVTEKTNVQQREKFMLKTLPSEGTALWQEFEVLKHLGKGNNADVWQVVIVGKVYALKVYFATPPKTGVNINAANDKDHFHREVRMYRRLQEAGLTGDVCPLYYGHYTVGVIAPGNDLSQIVETAPAILLEFVQGYTLLEFKRLPHNDDTKVRVVRSFISCYKRLFAAQIQHNSIKSLNLLVSHDGYKSYIIDFGRAEPLVDLWWPVDFNAMITCLMPIAMSITDVVKRQHVQKLMRLDNL